MAKEPRRKRSARPGSACAQSPFAAGRYGRGIALAAACVLAVLLAPLPRGAIAQIPPSPSDVAGYSGLHAAALAGDASQLAILIDAKADLEARDGYGRTAVHVATYAKQRSAIAVLARGGANLNALEHDRYDPVTIAAVAGDEATLAELLRLGASAKNITSRYDGTALIAAAHLGHDGVVKQLIAAGAPLDHVNNLHWTALIESIVLGDGGPRHTETLRTLVAAGASTKLADAQGNTPLALAKQRGYRPMVEILEKAGAK